jgi:hypothetical protein
MTTLHSFVVGVLHAAIMQSWYQRQKSIDKERRLLFYAYFEHRWRIERQRLAQETRYAPRR